MISGEFSLSAVKASLAENKVILEFSHELDKNTVTEDSVFIVDHDTRNVILTKNTVTGKVLELYAINGFEPNTEYTLLVQRTIRNIVGVEVADPVMRTLMFKSEILTVPKVLVPANYEQVKDLAVQWDVLDMDGNSVPLAGGESCQVQIAKENAFYNVVYDTIVTNSRAIDLPDTLSDGQYYVRLRNRAGSDIGKWSQVITFLRNVSEASPVSSDAGAVTESSSGGIEIVDLVDSPVAPGILTAEAEKTEFDVMPEVFTVLFSDEVDPSLEGLVFSVERSDI